MSENQQIRNCYVQNIDRVIHDKYRLREEVRQHSMRHHLIAKMLQESESARTFLQMENQQIKAQLSEVKLQLCQVQTKLEIANSQADFIAKKFMHLQAQTSKKLQSIQEQLLLVLHQNDKLELQYKLMKEREFQTQLLITQLKLNLKQARIDLETLSPKQEHSRKLERSGWDNPAEQNPQQRKNKRFITAIVDMMGKLHPDKKYFTLPESKMLSVIWQDLKDLAISVLDSREYI